VGEEQLRYSNSLWTNFWILPKCFTLPLSLLPGVLFGLIDWGLTREIPRRTSLFSADSQQEFAIQLTVCVIIIVGNPPRIGHWSYTVWKKTPDHEIGLMLSVGFLGPYLCAIPMTPAILLHGTAGVSKCEEYVFPFNPWLGSLFGQSYAIIFCVGQHPHVLHACIPMFSCLLVSQYPNIPNFVQDPRGSHDSSSYQGISLDT